MIVLSSVVLLLSFVFMLVLVGVLILLRRGDGPRYAASRGYDANRREAVRLLTGEVGDRVTAQQWYVPARREAVSDDPVAEPYREAVHTALAAVVSPRRQLVLDRGGEIRLQSEDARVIPAVSTADLRTLLDPRDDGEGLVIGLVLVNPEPPGGGARNVALPIQTLFPALGRAGCGDLVREFERLKDRVAADR